MVGPRQDPDRNPDAPPPEDAEGGVESLGSLLAGFGGWGTVGRGKGVLFVLFIFSAWYFYVCVLSSCLFFVHLSCIVYL